MTGNLGQRLEAWVMPKPPKFTPEPAAENQIGPHLTTVCGVQ